MKDRERKNEFDDTNEEGPKLIDIYKQSPISIELYDKNGKLIDVNQACLQMFGIKSSNDLKDISLFSNPYLTEQAIPDIRAGKSVKYELIYDFDSIKRKRLYKTSREGICFLECFISPSTYENKEISGYIVHTLEITERKKAEIQLINSEEKFRKIVESSTRGMYFYELDQSDQLVQLSLYQ